MRKDAGVALFFSVSPQLLYSVSLSLSPSPSVLDYFGITHFPE